MNPQELLDKVVTLIENLNRIGDSVEAGVKVFRDKLFPPDGVSASAADASGLSEEGLAAVNQAAADCTG